MTVTATTISMITNGKFSVGASGTITQDIFTYYLGNATVVASQELPSDINSVILDEAIALLVCHRIERSNGKMHLTGEDLGGEYSYTKKSEKTSWLVAYEEIKAAELNRILNLQKSVSNSVYITASHVSTSGSNNAFDLTGVNR